jgi:hypothetical protein
MKMGRTPEDVRPILFQRALGEAWLCLTASPPPDQRRSAAAFSASNVGGQSPMKMASIRRPLRNRAIDVPIAASDSKWNRLTCVVRFVDWSMDLSNVLA